MVTATANPIPSDVVPLTAEHKAAVLATAPVLAEHGVTITKHMYKVSSIPAGACVLLRFQPR